MKKIALISIIGLCGSCQALPQLFQAAEDIETQQAINIVIDKEALQKDTDLSITIDVTNKDQGK